MSGDRLRDQVFESLQRAVENGYSFEGWDVEAIAVDMLDCDQTFEGREPRELMPHIEAWRKERNGPRAEANH
jgi:hypothetical protein